MCVYWQDLFGFKRAQADPLFDMTAVLSGFAATWIDESLRLYGQVNKRTWWMPWQPEAMKDVVDCDKSRGAVKQALIREFPNGETHSIYRVSLTEYIG